MPNKVLIWKHFAIGILQEIVGDYPPTTLTTTTSTTTTTTTTSATGELKAIFTFSKMT